MATSAKFPTALLALVDVGGELPSFPEAVLSGAHNNSVTTITLTATVPTAWPTAGWVTIDSEIIQYAGKSGATLTGCTRGAQSAYGGSAQASHSDQAKVGFYLTPQAVNQIIQDLIALEKWEGNTTPVATIASSGTTDLSTVTSRYVQVTGTTTITAFGTVGFTRLVILEFAGALTLTHNATSLILRAGANATTAAGDIYAFVSEGSGNWREIWHLTNSSVSTSVSTFRFTDEFHSGNTILAAGASNLVSNNWFGNTVGGGGPIAFIASLANHPGILELDTSATTTCAVSLMPNGLTNIASSFLPADSFDMTWIVRPNSTVDANMEFRFGAQDTSTISATLAAPTNGIYVEKLTGDTQYFGVCRAAGAQTRTAALATVTNGTWVKIRIRRIDASTIGFTLDAGTEQTVTTNIPSVALLFWATIGNHSTANSRKLDVDLFDCTVAGLTR